MRTLKTTLRLSSKSSNIAIENDIYSQFAQRHRERIEELLGKTLYKDENHPIYNFLFRYFTFKSSRLFDYSPGCNVRFLPSALDTNKIGSDRVRKLATVIENNICQVYPYENYFTANQISAMKASLRVLYKTYHRPPSFYCFGLHEWAMQYKPEKDNCSSCGLLGYKQNLSCRVTAREIEQVIESRPLNCTHYDALRYFTPSSKPKNSFHLVDRFDKEKFDQPGCTHVHMDLFRYAVKLYPFVPSELLTDCLEVALYAREIDVRASPFDLFSYQPIDPHIQGLGRNFIADPIKVDTAEGRKEFQKHQEWLYQLSQPVRKELLDCYQDVLNKLQHDTKPIQDMMEVQRHE